jgi:hypothetical protein
MFKERLLVLAILLGLGCASTRVLGAETTKQRVVRIVQETFVLNRQLKRIIELHESGVSRTVWIRLYHR